MKTSTTLLFFALCSFFSLYAAENTGPQSDYDDTCLTITSSTEYVVIKKFLYQNGGAALQTDYSYSCAFNLEEVQKLISPRFTHYAGLMIYSLSHPVTIPAKNAGYVTIELVEMATTQQELQTKYSYTCWTENDLCRIKYLSGKEKVLPTDLHQAMFTVINNLEPMFIYADVVARGYNDNPSWTPYFYYTAPDPYNSNELTLWPIISRFLQSQQQKETKQQPTSQPQKTPSRKKHGESKKSSQGNVRKRHKKKQSFISQTQGFQKQ
ncbi:MAG: hypothetical protein H6679_04070 [Epsilonproteobacteria bacterium]|nr:hypothetical protein [Campylobacterota bacterium]